MAFTLWSRGELLGETELGYVRVFPKLRTGDLRVTPKGLAVIGRLTQARSDCVDTLRRLNRSKSHDQFRDAELKELTADMDSARDQEDAVALELRGPNGTVIPTEDIWVKDTEYLIALAAQADEEFESSESHPVEDAIIAAAVAEMEEHLAELEEDNPPWAQQEREPERFQIHVMLVNEWSIP